MPGKNGKIDKNAYGKKGKKQVMANAKKKAKKKSMSKYA
tara:strand:+ start:1353 stop:1469 length:117 start_codon:yes stop_codon:yes gene_type:complete